MNGLSKGREAEEPGAASRDLLVVAKGGGFLAAGDLFDYGSRFVASLILARVLGADEYGLYTLTVSLAFLVAGLANLGLDSAMERFVAVFRGRDDEPGVHGALQIGIGASLVAALTVSAVGFFGADQMARGIFDDPRLTPLIQVMAFTVPFLVMTTLLAAVVRGFKRMDYSALAEDLVQPLVRLVLIGLLAMVGLNAEIAVVIFGISYVFAVAVLVRMVRRLFSFERPARHARRDVRDIAAFSFPFWFSGLLTQVRHNIQPMLLGVYSTMANVGIFSMVSSANQFGRLASMSIRKSLRPTLAENLDQEQHEAAEHLYQATTRWMLTANLPISLMMMLYPTAILGLFGESFEAGAAALVVLAWAEVANAATGTCGVVIDMSGLNVVKLVNKVLEIALAIALNVIFIIQWGLIGAATAGLLATAAIQVMRLVEVWIIIGLHPYDRRTLKPVAAALAAAAAGLGIGMLIPADGGLGHLLFDGAVVGTVYVGTLIALGLSTDDRQVLRAVGARIRVPVRRRAGTP